MTLPTPLHGLHHVTAITANARRNLDFYHRVLGLRLVKKTVNQDELSAYHLFYADAVGSPGTEVTFFEWPHLPPAREGAGTASEIALQVPGDEHTLARWAAWFAQEGVRQGAIEPAEVVGRGPSLPFQDPEGQRLRLVAGPLRRPVHPWASSPVGEEAAVIGLSEVTLCVRDAEPTRQFLTEVLGFRAHPQDPHLFETGAGGAGAQLRLLESRRAGFAGVGGVHHVAWSVPGVAEQQGWREHLTRQRVANSGLVNRFWFQSLYFRIPGQILFEIATEGPGFTADGEDLAHLGENLSLPPFLESRRAVIEAGLAPLETPVFA